MSGPQTENTNNDSVFQDQFIPTNTPNSPKLETCDTLFGKKRIIDEHDKLAKDLHDIEDIEVNH